jgi:purine-nucleoside phosphorylase
MFISDVINLGGANPLVGPNNEDGPRFPDMSAPLSPDWLDRAEQSALSHGIQTQRGVYLWTLGPSYETKAEIRFFRTIGADAVGMSTVPEVIQARYLDMQVLGISTITNFAAGLHPEKLNHEDVLKVGNRVRSQLETLIRLIVRDIR